jgi:hypothetical protein
VLVKSFHFFFLFQMRDDTQHSLLYKPRPYKTSVAGSRGKEQQESRELSLLEQIEERKKDFTRNFEKEVQRLNHEIHEASRTLKTLQNGVGLHRESVRAILQTEARLGDLRHKLDFLKSGKAAHLLQQRIEEFNASHRMRPIAPQPPKPILSLTSPSIRREARSTDTEARLREKLKLDQAPSLEDEKWKEATLAKHMLTEDDPYFSNLNDQSTQRELRFEKDVKRSQEHPQSVIKHIKRVDVKEPKENDIPPEYDILNALYLPKSHLACIQAAATQVDEPVKPAPQLGPQGGAQPQVQQSLRQQYLFCSCGLPMLDKQDMGRIFCYCGLSRVFRDIGQPAADEPVSRPTPVQNNKKTSQVSSSLHEYKPMPWVKVPDHVFSCLQKEQNLQILRSRRPISGEQIKNTLHKNGLAKTHYPHRHQIATHYTGQPPPRYLTPEEEAHYVGKLQKDPSAVSRWKLSGKRPMLERFQSGVDSMTLLEFIDQQPEILQAKEVDPRSSEQQKQEPEDSEQDFEDASEAEAE